MKVNYEDGKIEFDLHGILEQVKGERRVEMIESLSCDDEVIRHVSDQIIERWTETCYSGGSCIIPKAHPKNSSPLDIAWRKVSKMSGEVAKHEIEKLERTLKNQEEQIKKHHEEIQKIHKNYRGTY